MERERLLLSCLRLEGLGEPEELLELELRDVLELPERLDAEEELEPLLEPVLVLEPELEVELDRDLTSETQVSRATVDGSISSKQMSLHVLVLPRGNYCPPIFKPQYLPSSGSGDDIYRPNPSQSPRWGQKTAFTLCSDRKGRSHFLAKQKPCLLGGTDRAWHTRNTNPAWKVATETLRPVFN